MERIPVKNILILFTTALIWGVAFVAQQVSMNYIGPFAFVAIRYIMGALVLISVIIFLNKSKAIKFYINKETLVGGLLCGVILFAGSSLQQIGIQTTTVAKAGFITALYIIIVPILGIFLKKTVGGKVWIAVFIAAVGLYLLTMNGQFYLGKGDTLLFVCAIVYSLHILCIDYYIPKADAITMSCIQFIVAGVLGTGSMFSFETLPSMELLNAAMLPLLYTGILSTGVAYTIQIIGQKGVNPTVASLILSLESVISAVAAWLLINQVMTGREILGAGLMFAAIVLVQLPNKVRQRKLQQEVV